MAEWIANQILIPRDEVSFSSFIEEEEEIESSWSDNLLNKISGGFVRQVDIYGLPGIKIYAGPSLSSTKEAHTIDKYLILGPSGMFSMKLEDGYLLTDIRIAKESYELLTSGLGGFVAFNIISSYTPSSSTGRVIVYNGGGVNEDVE